MNTERKVLPRRSSSSEQLSSCSPIPSIEREFLSNNGFVLRNQHRIEESIQAEQKSKRQSYNYAMFVALAEFNSREGHANLKNFTDADVNDMSNLLRVCQEQEYIRLQILSHQSLEYASKDLAFSLATSNEQEPHDFSKMLN